MGKVICILGPHGVGKTTLQDYIEKTNQALVYRGFIIPSTDLDFDTKDHYTNYQKKYINLINEQNKQIKNSTLNGFVIRGIEEVPFYFSQSKFKYSRTEIDTILKGSIKSDYVVYLSADYNTLMYRCDHDEKRDMAENNDWYCTSYIAYERYFKNLPNVIVIETSNKKTEDVFNEIMEKL